MGNQETVIVIKPFALKVVEDCIGNIFAYPIEFMSIMAFAILLLIMCIKVSNHRRKFMA